MRVPNSFFGIRDFSYLRLGIRDNKAKSEILRGRWEGKNNPRDYGIARNFTGLKNPIGDPLLLKLFDARVPIRRLPRFEMAYTPANLTFPLSLC